MATNYIKSYSNYVLKKHHQTLDDNSKIYERDITTIGGVNRFSKGQTPIYQSGNFIITINNDFKSSRNFISDNWEGTLTLKDLNLSEKVKEESNNQIVLKQDYYKLQDFAYFGSCTELVRASILDIVNRFPGELFVPTIKDNGIAVYYSTYDKEGNLVTKRLGGDKNLVLVDNPSNIDIHTKQVSDEELINNPLKYLYHSKSKYDYFQGNNKDIDLNIVSTTNSKKGDLLSTITISSKTTTSGNTKINNDTTIYAYVGDNCNIIYLIEYNEKYKDNGVIIRPKQEFIEDFFNSLDSFQKVLLNRETNYTALFEIKSENKFGYTTELKSFTFPKLHNSNYNLAFNDPSYDNYIGNLQKYAMFYDDRFCDNIWRSMTHESIKNFDWTYTREYEFGEDEEFIHGGTKMQKTLRLIGREFDEIKSYIDALGRYQIIDYGKDNSLPDYFLTDSLSLEGWDVKNIFPYKYENDKFSVINELKDFQPYKSNESNFYWKCNCDTNKVEKTYIDSENSNSENVDIYDKCSNRVKPIIKKYKSNKTFTLNDVNNHFMKMLKLNSKSIFRKKGTIECIESLMSIFGLKSKRWCESIGKKDEFDYDVIEYVTATNCITDEYLDTINWYNELNKDKKVDNISSDKPFKNYKIDWINSTKTITYNDDNYINDVYVNYQGLPVRVYVKDDDNNYFKLSNAPEKLLEHNKKNKRYLFPYFSKHRIIDGNPYYQMNGGWFNRFPKIFDCNGNMIETIDKNHINLFKETYRNIKNIYSIKDLLSVPISTLKNGDVYYVQNISTDYVLIDGNVYDLYTDENNNKYINVYVVNGTCKIGYTFYYTKITVSQYDGTNKTYSFNDMPNNSEIKIYINNGKMNIIGSNGETCMIQFYQNGEIKDSYETKKTFKDNETKKQTQYFKINNIDFKNEIGNQRGWNVLYTEDKEYKYLNSILDTFSGNNPHTGHINYDGGNEYISYFTQLFKHALKEENQFNFRCYGDDYFTALEYIKTIGFDDLNNNNFIYCYPEYKDNKIHFFGNYFKNDDKTQLKKLKKKKNTDTSNLKHVTNTVMDDYKELCDKKIITTQISDHIVNTKRVDIIFNNKNDNDNACIKYYNDIIMNYLEQILPSTLIINVKYINI